MRETAYPVIRRNTQGLGRGRDAKSCSSKQVAPLNPHPAQTVQVCLIRNLTYSASSCEDSVPPSLGFRPAGQQQQQQKKNRNDRCTKNRVTIAMTDCRRDLSATRRALVSPCSEGFVVGRLDGDLKETFLGEGMSHEKLRPVRRYAPGGRMFSPQHWKLGRRQRRRFHRLRKACGETRRVWNESFGEVTVYEKLCPRIVDCSLVNTAISKAK